VENVFLRPINGLLDRLGVNKLDKTAGEATRYDGLTNDELAAKLGMIADGMPEELAGQKMHDEKTPMDAPEKSPAAPKIENTKDQGYRLQSKTEDNLDSLKQTSAPLSNPGDLDINQDPLARMAAKIACAIEEKLASADKSLAQPAGRLVEDMEKDALFSKATDWVKANPGKAMGAGALAGTAIGGGLGYLFGHGMGKERGAETEKANDDHILNLGALIGAKMAERRIVEQLQNQGAEEGKDGN
jgi:hypothetical protein